MTLEPLRILFVAANPADSARLAFDHEFAAVEAALAGTPMASRIRLEPALAVDLHRLTGKLLDTRPTVLHFAGHGVRRGLLLESAEPGSSELVSIDAITGLLADLGETVRLVTLNACYSETLARVLTKVVPFAVGMPEAADGAPRPRRGPDSSAPAASARPRSPARSPMIRGSPGSTPTASSGSRSATRAGPKTASRRSTPR